MFICYSICIFVFFKCKIIHKMQGNSELITFVLLPILIFVARIVDVSLGTIRIIFVSKGYKYIAPMIGFFEILIWILAISRIMANLNNWLCYVSYAGGFAAGNYIGMLLEERLAIGYEQVRVITKKGATELIKVLRENGYGITSVKATGNYGEVAVIYIIINRKDMKKVIGLIQKYNPNALYTVEDIRSVSKQVLNYPNAGNIRSLKQK